MPTAKIVNEHKMLMQKTADHLHSEFRTVRTGRASAGIVENLSVEYYGTPTPLKQLASIATPDAEQIVIKPFDPGALKEIEKAIRSSDLSLSPISDGKMIRLNVPPLSEERRKQIAAQIKKMGEQSKIGIRNIRRDGIKKLEDAEKAGTITEDNLEHGKKEMDELVKQFTDKIDDAIKIKTDEVMKV